MSVAILNQTMTVQIIQEERGMDADVNVIARQKSENFMEEHA
jgi:hypothetical protein